MKLKKALLGGIYVSLVLIVITFAISKVNVEASLTGNRNCYISEESRMEEDNNLAGLEKCTIRVFVDNNLVDTLTCDCGEKINLTNNYKNLSVREWSYSVSYTDEQGVNCSKRISVFDQDVEYEVTKNDDIRGYSVLMEPASDISDVIDNKAESRDLEYGDVNQSLKKKDKDKCTAMAVEKKKLPSPCLLRYIRSKKKIIVRGQKQTIVVVKIGNKKITVKMGKSTKHTIILKKRLKKGTNIKIYAKKSGFKNSKIRTYKV